MFVFGVLALALFLALQFAAPAFSLDAEMTNLSKLEQKFFHHDYPKDDKTVRIERLEKLVYGEAKSGGNEERISSLLTLISDLSPPKVADDSPSQTPEAKPALTAQEPVRQEPESDEPENNGPVANASSYPAVTAIEKKLFGRDYVGESVANRLERLETKAFGKKSTSEDMQERMDKLKAYTGIDVAKVAPAGSDWSDEDEAASETAMRQPEIQPDMQPDIQPFTGLGSAGRGRDLVDRSGRPIHRNLDPYAGSGTFGAGGMPPRAPELARDTMPMPAPNAVGMNQQLALLEKEVFRKTYSNETIPARLNRLESTVFPSDKTAADKALPDRVSRLVTAVPISQANNMEKPKPRRDPDFPDMDDMDLGGIPVAPQRTQGGLSKIINGLGNMLGGGGSYTTGGYAGGPGTLVNDPATGMLYDQYTGTLIDPMTGAVVGRRSTTSQTYGGFGSGFSQVSPYGMGGSGMGFGFGGSGIRFGSGMWP
ncbi:MAG: hypothetical protein K2W82_13340 [Candidatus Obscuribacterales bacterium]|nr:hypothetical protein [Candidatus Obscuribacterales bacterium]